MTRKGSPSLLARVVGHLLFWSPGIFITSCVIFSIAADLYGQPPADGLVRAEHTWCLREALSLRDGLRGQATLALGPSVKSKVRERWRDFESDYDTRLEAAATRCRDTEALRTAFDQLREVFQAYRQIIGENHALLEGSVGDLDRTLQILGGPRADAP